MDSREGPRLLRQQLPGSFRFALCQEEVTCGDVVTLAGGQQLKGHAAGIPVGFQFGQERLISCCLTRGGVIVQDKGAVGGAGPCRARLHPRVLQNLQSDKNHTHMD
jgi:hypothetical protein